MSNLEKQSSYPYFPQFKTADQANVSIPRYINLKWRQKGTKHGHESWWHIWTKHPPINDNATNKNMLMSSKPKQKNKKECGTEINLAIVHTTQDLSLDLELHFLFTSQ